MWKIRVLINNLRRGAVSHHGANNLRDTLFPPPLFLNEIRFSEAFLGVGDWQVCADAERKPGRAKASQQVELRDFELAFELTPSNSLDVSIYFMAQI